ncbi:acyl carrier protein [uncultured Shewanella sp.]|uniref:acyl carrier protein n=1 Tax=uncultured Shewanella sp. TaxID=173975 RepID=UPI002607495E|nr:acyl carrier protein [uncultured Shewanella sp.]
MKNREQILETLTKILVEEFEIDEKDVSLNTSLYDELDLDSIDAVDLVIKLQQITGKKIHPDTFKAVRTVDDVVSAVEALVSAA